MADAVSDAPAGSPRRGSFLETWRVFASGWGKVGMLGLFFAGWIVIGTIVMGVSGRRALAPNVLMLLSMLPVATYSLERQLADRLAFLSLIPQPVPTKWLVLAPMCALGLLTALASGALSSKAPAISILALLGSAWWMVGSARWLHRFGPWIVVACVFVLLAPVASFVAYRVGGWAAAAARGKGRAVGRAAGSAITTSGVGRAGEAWFGPGGERAIRHRLDGGFALVPGTAVSADGRDGFDVYPPEHAPPVLPDACGLRRYEADRQDVLE